jgi:hypothetical protein
MTVTVKMYYIQFSQDMTDEEKRLTKIYNWHIHQSVLSMTRHFVREGILVVDDTEYNDFADVVDIVSHTFILNDKFLSNDMYKNMCGDILPDSIPEVYEFTTKCDITIGDVTVTKYIRYGTDTNKHKSKYKYYCYHEILDNNFSKCRNIKDI